MFFTLLGCYGVIEYLFCCMIPHCNELLGAKQSFFPCKAVILAKSLLCKLSSSKERLVVVGTCYLATLGRK